MIWTILLALTLFCRQCESSKKPKISSTTHKVFHVRPEDRSDFDESDRYLTVEAGKTVVLTCEVGGGQEVNWTTPNPILDTKRITMRSNKLSIRNSIYSDTGGYSCRTAGGSLTDNVHLYIRDEAQLFLQPSHFLTANVFTDSSSPTRVGCQATDPRATFRLQNHNMEDITDSLEESELAWSHQTGLWVVRGNLEFQAGILTCSLSVPGGSTGQQRLTVRLISPPHLTPPRIIRVEPRHPFIGGNLTVSCLTEVNKKDLIYHGINLVLKSPNTAGQQDRVEVSERRLKRGRDENFRVIERFDLIFSLSR